MHVAIGSDHAGFELKEAVKTFLAAEHHEVFDVGTHNQDPVDYPDYAHRLAEALGQGRAEFGILVCGAGIGMSIAANRHAGIRAANCIDERMAALAREHNDANVLCLGSRLLDPDQAKKIVWTFLETPFGGGRHRRRVDKIEAGQVARA